MLKTFSGRTPSQNEYELSSFIALLKAREVVSYCEIGAREGDTFHDIVSSLPKGSRALAVDLPGGYWGKSTTGSKLEKACDDLRQKGYDVGFLLGDSTSASIISKVRMCAPFDAILIDGDHRYEGVKRDWQNYGSMGKLIAFHDIVGKGQFEKVHNTEVQVPRLWQELKSSGVKSVEFIDQGSAMGIGALLCDSQ